MPGMGDRRMKLYMLDKELCCALYMRLGSYDKVGARLETEGIINPISGIPFSRGGLATIVKKSEMYHNYYLARAKNPDMPLDPTKEELDHALEVIQELLPRQKSLVEEAAARQAYRVAHESMYLDKKNEIDRVPAPK
jgi:hypothetical protein